MKTQDITQAINDGPIWFPKPARAGQNFNYSLVLQKIDVPPFYLSLSLPFRRALSSPFLPASIDGNTVLREINGPSVCDARFHLISPTVEAPEFWRIFHKNVRVRVCKIVESQRSIYIVLFYFYRNRDYWRIYLDLFDLFREFILLPFHRQHH